jgi:hypothetical protein
MIPATAKCFGEKNCPLKRDCGRYIDADSPAIPGKLQVIDSQYDKRARGCPNQTIKGVAKGGSYV